MSTRTTKDALDAITQLPAVKAADDRIEAAKRHLAAAELGKRALIEAELKRLNILGLRVVYAGKQYEVVSYTIVGGAELWLSGRLILADGSKSPALTNLFTEWRLPGEVG